MARIEKTGVELVAEGGREFERNMQRARGEVSDFGRQTQEFAKASTFRFRDVASAAGMLTGALTGIVGAGRELIDTFTTSAQAAGSLSRALQISEQAASRVLEVTDDFGISNAQMRASLRFALNQGVVPTIDGLARLSDEYLGITDDQERARWAQKRLGRQWMDFTRILEAGGATIRQAGADVSESLIFDAADVRMAEDYRVAVDELGDAWRALKAAGGRRIVPEAAEWLQDITMLAEGGNVLDYIRLRFQHTFHETDQEMQDWVNNVQWHAGELDEGFSQLEPTAADLWLTLNDGRNAGGAAAAGLSSPVGPSRDLRDALAGLNTNLADVISNFRTNMAWITGGGLQLEAAAQSVMNALLGGRITQEEADAMLRPIEAAALGLQEDIGQISMSDAQQQMIDDWGGGWGDARAEIQGARDDIETLPAEVQTQIRVQVQWELLGGRRGLEGYQHGGSFMVGGRGGVDRNLVAFRASRGEVVSVTPPAVYNSSANSYDNRQLNIGQVGPFGGGGVDMANPFERDRVFKGWFGA